MSGFVVVDRRPLGERSPVARYLVLGAHRAEGFPGCPVVAGPFPSRRGAEEECGRLNEADRVLSS